MPDQSRSDPVVVVHGNFLLLFEGVHRIRLNWRDGRLDRLLRHDLPLLLCHVRVGCFGVHASRFPPALVFHTCPASSPRSLRSSRTVPAPASRRSSLLLRPVATATTLTPATCAALTSCGVSPISTTC